MQGPLRVPERMRQADVGAAGWGPGGWEEGMGIMAAAVAPSPGRGASGRLSLQDQGPRTGRGTQACASRARTCTLGRQNQDGGSSLLGPWACRSLSPTSEDAWAQLASPDWNVLGTSFGESQVTEIFSPSSVTQYVSVGAFRAHLLKGANYTSSIKQTLLYQRSHVLDRKCPKRSLIVNWLSVFFFKDGNFCSGGYSICRALSLHLCNRFTR